MVVQHNIGPKHLVVQPCRALAARAKTEALENAYVIHIRNIASRSAEQVYFTSVLMHGQGKTLRRRYCGYEAFDTFSVK